MTTVAPLPDDPAAPAETPPRPASDSVEAWLRALLVHRKLGTKANALFLHLLTHPSKASYAGAQELATDSGTTVASVTRLAQNLGFEGWPDFQRQIRTRYLSHLSAVDVARAHQDVGRPSQASIQQDLDSMSIVTREADHDQLQRIAETIAAAERVFIGAQGSYASVAIAWAHNTRLAGYNAEAIVDGGATLANAIATIGPRDVYIVVSFWRLYEASVIAAAEAKDRGASVIVIADTVPPDLLESCDEVVLIPSEGASFFPSLTASMAVQQAIVTALAHIDVEKTDASIKAADSAWRRFKLLHR